MLASHARCTAMLHEHASSRTLSPDHLRAGPTLGRVQQQLEPRERWRLHPVRDACLHVFQRRIGNGDVRSQRSLRGVLVHVDRRRGRGREQRCRNDRRGPRRGALPWLRGGRRPIRRFVRSSSPQRCRPLGLWRFLHTSLAVPVERLLGLPRQRRHVLHAVLFGSHRLPQPAQSRLQRDGAVQGALMARQTFYDFNAASPAPDDAN